MKRLILHIGLEKTGTTAFQAFCAGARERLAEIGVCYPANPACYLNDNHAPLAASYFSAEEAERLAIFGRSADRAEAVAALKAESAQAPVTLVSAEHFSSRFDPGRIGLLREDVSEFEASVAVVVRDPFARALSAYATAVASGRDPTLDAFIDELCAPGNLYLRARATLDVWAGVFGRDALIVVPYREGEDMVPVLGARLTPNWPRDDREWRRNVSPSAEEIERRRRANERGPAAQLLVKLAHRVAGDAPGEPARLTPQQQARIAAVVADDTEALRRDYGVAFG